MKGRVLVVDDDAALAEMLGIVLRGEGFDQRFEQSAIMSLDGSEPGEVGRRPLGRPIHWRQAGPELLRCHLPVMNEELPRFGTPG